MLYFKILVIAIFVSGLSSVKSQKPDNDGAPPLHHLVVIYCKNSTKFICGGSLIHPKWVLSSATCVLDLLKESKEIAVAAGLIPHKLPEQMKEVTEHVIHKLFDPKSPDLHNFALVKVEDIPKSNLVDVSRLPDRGEEACAKPKALVFQQSPTSRRIFDIIFELLQELFPFLFDIFNIFRNQDQDQYMRNVVYSFSAKILNRSIENCEKGHGGWPLVCGETIIGIENKCQRSGPDIDLSFANVESDLDFITEVTGLKSQNKKEFKTEGSYSSKLHSNHMVLLAALLLVTLF